MKRIVRTCSIFAQDTRVSGVYNALSEIFDIRAPYNDHYSRKSNECTVEFVNAFYSSKGFEKMAHRINDLSRPLSLDEVRDVMRPLFRCSEVLLPKFKTETAAKIAPALRARLLRVTFEDVRSEKRDAAGELLKILASMLRDRAVPAAYAAFRDISLHLSASLVRLPVFEKRITGIREICSWAAAAAAANTSADVTIDVNGESLSLGAWIVKNGVLDALFGRAEDVHLEVAKRSKELLAIVARDGLFDEQALGTVLPCCLAGHESVRAAMCAAFAAAVPGALGPKSLLFLDNALAGLDLALFTADYVATLVEEVVAAELGSPVPGSAGPGAWKCPAKLWALAQDDSPLPAPLALATLRRLCGVLAKAPASDAPVLKHYQALALENLRNHVSPYQAIYFLAHSAPTSTSKQKPSTQKSQNQNQQQGQQNQNQQQNDLKPFDAALQGVADPEEVVQAFLEDCVYYKTDVVSELRDEIAAKDGALAPAGAKAEYAADVEERLAFMARALRESGRVRLTRAAVEKLWEAFVTNAFTRAETERALDFFIAAADIPENPMSKDVVGFLFPEMTVTLDPRTVGHKELDFVECFFIRHNAMEGHYVRDPASGRLLVSNINLIGTEIVWDICLKTEDRSVGIRAVDSILGVLTTLDAPLRPRINAYRENVLCRCIRLLKEQAQPHPAEEPQADATTPATLTTGPLDAMARPQDPLVLSSAPVVTPANRLGVCRTLLMVYNVLASVIPARSDAHNVDTKQLVRLSVVIPAAKDARIEVVVPQKTTLRQLREKLVAENPAAMHPDYALFRGKDLLCGSGNKDNSSNSGDDAATLLSLGITADGTVLTARRNITLSHRSPGGNNSAPQSPPAASTPTTNTPCNEEIPEFDLEKSVVVTPEAYSLLFKVLVAPEVQGSDDYPCPAIAAMILNMLPTCPALMRKLRSIGEPAASGVVMEEEKEEEEEEKGKREKGEKEGEVRWADLVSLEMGPRFLMYFIPSLLAFLHGEAAGPSWKEEFVKKGGAAYVAGLFMDCDVAAVLGLGATATAMTTATTNGKGSEPCRGLAENTKCYYLVSDLLRVLEELFITQSGEFVVVPGLNVTRFYLKLLDVCALLCTEGVRLMGAADDDSVSRCFRLIVGVVTKYCQRDVYDTMTSAYLMSWIRCTLIEAPLAKHRQITMQSLIGISRILPPESDVFQNFALAFWNILPFVSTAVTENAPIFVGEYFNTLEAVNKNHYCILLSLTIIIPFPYIADKSLHLKRLPLLWRVPEDRVRRDPQVSEGGEVRGGSGRPHPQGPLQPRPPHRPVDPGQHIYGAGLLPSRVL